MSVYNTNKLLDHATADCGGILDYGMIMNEKERKDHGRQCLSWVQKNECTWHSKYTIIHGLIMLNKLSKLDFTTN